MFDWDRAERVLSGSTALVIDRGEPVGSATFMIPRPVRRPDGMGGWRVLMPGDPEPITAADISSQEWEELPLASVEFTYGS